MAGLRFTLSTGGKIALSSATAKTILQVRAPTNQRLEMHGFAVSFDGIDGTDEPVLVELLRYSTNGGMFSAGLVKNFNIGSETIQSVGVRNASSEPSAADVLRYWHIHPQTGIDKEFNEGEITLEGGGRLGLRLTAPDNVEVVGHMDMEE